MKPDSRFLAWFDGEVRARGFFAWGAAPAAPVADAPFFRAYLAKGLHGGMHYLAHHLETRLDPRLLLDGARTVLIFLRAYCRDAFPIPAGHGRVAAYARGQDYHRSIARDLKALAALLPGTDARLCVDTAPLMERYWVRTAGLACTGNNGLCLREDAGSAFFVGALVTRAVFPPMHPPYRDLCGTCDACLRACPTGALVAPRVMDARRCLSYLTIEHRGTIGRDARRALHDTVFGCDRCQDACPYNRRVRVPAHPDFRPRPPLAAPALADILAWDEPVFRALTARSVVRRATGAGLKRNALIAAAGCRDVALLRAAARYVDTPELMELAAELLSEP